MPVDHVINISLHLTEKNVFSCLLIVGITGYSRYSCTLKSLLVSFKRRILVCFPAMRTILTLNKEKNKYLVVHL